MSSLIFSVKLHLPVIAMLGLLLTSCATRPISNAEAIHVPSEQILSRLLLEQKPKTGQVVIKRDSGIFGSACSSRVFVDGNPVADIGAAEKIVLYIPEGEHIFSAWPNGICGGGMSEVKAMVRAGSQSNFRIGYGSNGDFTINPTAI